MCFGEIFSKAPSIEDYSSWGSTEDYLQYYYVGIYVYVDMLCSMALKSPQRKTGLQFMYHLLLNI